MKKSITVGLFIAAFCLSIVACDQFKTTPQKWEYQTLIVTDPSDANQLNKVGKDGWELVSILPPGNYGFKTFGDTFYCLKRPLAQ